MQNDWSVMISSRNRKHVWLRVGRTEIWKAQRLELSWLLARNVWRTDRVGIWIWGSQRVREHKEWMPFPVSLFCFKWEGMSVLPLRRTCLSLQFIVYLLCLSTVVCELSHVTHDHSHGSRSCCLCKKIVSSPCVTHDVARAFIFIFLLAHERSTFVCLFFILWHQPLRSRCRSKNTATIHRMSSMAVWPKQPLLQVYEPNLIDNSDYSETHRAIFQNESVDIDTELSYSFDAELDDELIRKAPSSPLFNQEREEPANLRTSLSLSWRKVCYQLSLFFTRTSTVKPVYEPSSNLSQKRKSSRDLEHEQIKRLLERQKEQILAGVRSEIQKHKPQAESDRKSIHELTGIIESQRTEIDHTIAGCEQSRRDQFTFFKKERIRTKSGSSWNIVSGTCRDMEELQKSHVLKVEELSRRKLTEDFEAVTSFFQGSNVKTVCNFGDNDAKYPDAEIDDVHTRNSPASPLYLQEREASASLLQAFTHKEKAWFNVHSQFSASTAEPVTWMSQKAQI